MLKKTISYVDYNGVNCTEDLYFNLTQTELMKMESEIPGGLHSYMENVVNTSDPQKMFKLYEMIINRAYGEKSPDGKRFMKSDEISENFMHSAVYDSFYMELLTKDGELEKFIKGILPANLQKAE